VSDGIINNEILDKLVNINIEEITLLQENISRIKDSIILLNECYNGSDLKFISSGALEQFNNLNKIIDVNKSYIEVLKDVKTFYNAQDQEMKYAVDSLNSRN